MTTGGGVGPEPPPGLVITPPTIPAAAAPPAITATVPMASPAPAATANPAGAMIEAPLTAENTVTAPGGPNAAIFRSPHSDSSSTTIALISWVWLSSNSVVVVCR